MALVAVPVAIAAVVVQGTNSGSASDDGTTTKAGRRAQIAPAGQGALRVRGTGFVPRERVELVLKGQTNKRRTVSANERGSFEAVFGMVSSCDSITVSASGSRGSRAGFNLSSYVCAAP